jgi:hypothetical protein
MFLPDSIATPVIDLYPLDVMEKTEPHKVSQEHYQAGYRFPIHAFFDFAVSADEEEKA